MSLSTIKCIVQWLPTGWQHRLSLLYYRYSIRRELEPMEFAVIRPLLDGGATIVDAGANIGLYSAFLARHAGLDAEIISIEPIPSTYDILRSNLTSLKLRNVRTLRCALSDQHRLVMCVLDYFFLTSPHCRQLANAGVRVVTPDTGRQPPARS